MTRFYNLTVIFSFVLMFGFAGYAAAGPAGEQVAPEQEIEATDATPAPATAENDPCAAYQSERAVQMCEERMLRIERIQQSRERRQEQLHEDRQRLQNRESRYRRNTAPQVSDEAEAAESEAAEADENAPADSAVETDPEAVPEATQ